MLSIPKLTEIGTVARGKGALYCYSTELMLTLDRSFVEFETAADMNAAVTKLNNTEFKSQTVRCTADVSTHKSSSFSFRTESYSLQQQPDRPRERMRSRSPTRSRGYYSSGPSAYYDDPRRRDYSPPRDYRRRTPPPRDYYDPRDRYGPPSSGAMRVEPPVDGRYRLRGYSDDGYGPNRRRPYDDPYMNGYGSAAYGRAPSPRGPSPSHNGYPSDYDRRRW